MTLKELYQEINGDYEQAVRVLRMDKLIDKHIRKLPTNGVVDGLIEAGCSMEPALLFEKAHALKGVCANLGLTVLAAEASDIAEEYRPGNSRRLSDDEIKNKIDNISRMYKRTVEGIRRYEEGLTI